ncbi:hypothetical protein U9M48_029619 [Paspalum notatum var. saurae]|uniref:DUF295 domain-containing protein n=1 Tax=Paspalum notatum var. saurae TaxID=547442 RepID=A0AAQ3TZ05_PASNO
MAARRRQCSSWSDFLPELLNLVLRRLPSLADRVRLRAVCRPWRDHVRLEQQPLPPPLPWLTLLDGTFLSFPDAEVHCLPLPGDTHRCHGSVGNNWLFIEHTGGRCSLTNPFSKAAVPVRLPSVYNMWHRHEETDAAYPKALLGYLKLVLLSSSPPSPHSPFAVLTVDSECGNNVCIIQPPMMASSSTFRVPKPSDHEGKKPFILDVAFFDGKLYALTQRKLFVVLDNIDDSNANHYKAGGSPETLVIPPMKCIVDSDSIKHDPRTAACLSAFANQGYERGFWGYLVESRGRLLYVSRLLGVLSSVPEESKLEHARTLSFDLFEFEVEADLTTNNTARGQWKRVSSVGGQALFVGKHSKSLPASECRAQEDCIYFMHDYDRGGLDSDPFRDCGVFNMRNGMITPLLPQTAMAVQPQGDAGRPAWFFPADEA